ncbi:DoxX family membrane protein [Palleniella muris]|uniref:DoxX family membrane protein n=1 Tax=Palleniella muris TaxID=3038145 RepID=A0AC61QPE0_9BACT|nr:BT_3928 family protein [Palleniella muris]TGX81574.1 DoxX family membrane protein [Palleniella muris]
MDKRKIANAVIVNLSRVLVGVVFVFSGFSKAVDPLGTVYKFQDYLAALGLGNTIPDALLLLCAVALSTVELAMGVFTLLAIWRRKTSKAVLALMAVMLLLSVWIYAADPVQDCGCFGDALVLANRDTLIKNIILTACAIVLARYPLSMPRMLGKNIQWMTVHITVAGSIVLSGWCLYDLPVVDFRPYHVGADIRQGMIVPEDAEQPEFETVFIMEKDGRREEFSLENYPDSTWTFIDSRTTVVKQGYVPPIHDFSITTSDGADITDDVLSYKGYTFLLIAPFLEKADDSNFGEIDQIYEFADDNAHRFYCLTSSGEKAVGHWRDITGAEYPFCFTDGTTLKTIVRSNPGLLLLKDGRIIGKWSHNLLPSLERLSGMIKTEK